MSNVQKLGRSTIHLKSSTQNLGNLTIINAGTNPFPDLNAFADVSFAPQYSRLHNDPLDVIEKCKVSYRLLSNGYQRQLYELLALMYGFAKYIVRNDGLMQEFMAKDFWKHRKYNVASEPLQLVIQFCMDAPNDSPAYHRACTYARALSPAFDNDIPMEDVAHLIAESGGIEKLAAPRVPINPTLEAEDEAEGGKLFHDLAQGDCDLDQDQDQDQDSTPTSVKRDRSGSGVTSYRFDPTKDLAVEAAGLLDNVLEAEDRTLMVLFTQVSGKPGEFREVTLIKAIPMGVHPKKANPTKIR